MGKVLLVDDENILREVTKDIIVSLGHEVVDFPDAESAIDFYKENHQHIDLVIIDFILPEMNGAVLFDRLKSINRKIKTIIVSGFFSADEKHKLTHLGILDVFQKPVPHEKMKEILKKHMDNEPVVDTETAIDDDSSDIPVFNLKSGLNNLGGNKELLSNILNDIRSNYPSKISEIRKQINLGDQKNTHRLIHGYKSLFKTIGANKVAEKAKQLELKIKTEGCENIAEDFADFESEFNLLLDEIDAGLKN